MLSLLRKARDPWWRAYWRIRSPKTTIPPVRDELAVRAALLDSPIPFREFEIDIDRYREWMRAVDYPRHFPGYYTDNLVEKTLEHYVVARFLNLRPGETYIDVAGQSTTVADIYARMFGVESYSQDLDYPAGIDGRRIGGSTARMPVPDGFADAMGLHCSFEHFEGDADIGFLREAARVLRPGGRIVIAPLYLYQEYLCLTYPPMAAGCVSFEPDINVCALTFWKNRHGRFYDVPHLVSRLWNNRGPLSMTIHAASNYREVHESVYLQYVAVIEKAAGE